MATTNLISKTIGDILRQHGNGIPDHSASLGSVYTDLDVGLMYENNDGGTGWTTSEAFSSALKAKLEGLTKRNNVVVVNSNQDLIDAATTYVGGVITLPTNSYCLGDNIDLLGDRIAFDTNAIVGFNSGSVKNNKITSTGLGGNLFTIIDAEIAFREITICNPGGNFLNAVNTGKTKEIIIDGCHLDEFLMLGVINGFKDIHIEECHFSSFDEGFTITGSLRHFHLSQCFVKHSRLNATGLTKFLTFNNVISEILDISNCNFESVQAGDVVVDVTSGATFSTTAIVQRNNFVAYTVLPIAGANANSPDWHIPSRTNIGLAGLFKTSRTIILGTVSSTTSNAWLSITQQVLVKNNASDYEDNATIIEGSLVVSMTHTGSGDTVGFRLYNLSDAHGVGFSGINSKGDVDTIIWQSGTTVRYTFNGTPDLANITIGEIMTVEDATNVSNNGLFEITAFDDVGDWVEVTNIARTDATDDEATDSTANAWGGSYFFFNVTTGDVYDVNETQEFNIDLGKQYRVQIIKLSGTGGQSVYANAGDLSKIIY